MFLRHDEHVDGCVRVDIPEGKERFILVNDIRGFLTGDDPAKETILFHGIPA
jgi:hypothetical protein